MYNKSNQITYLKCKVELIYSFTCITCLNPKTYKHGYGCLTFWESPLHHTCGLYACEMIIYLYEPPVLVLKNILKLSWFQF